MHQHAGPGAARGRRDGPADVAAAIPAGRTGAVGTQRQRHDARVLLRPHLGRAGGNSAVRLQRLVYGNAERADTDVHGHHGQRGPCAVQSLVRIRTGHGDRRHRLRLGNRAVDGRGPLRPAALRMLPQDTDRNRLGGGGEPETAQDLLHRKPRHHAAHVLHRGRLHLLHGGVGPHGRTGAAGRQHAAAAVVYALLVHERRIRIRRRSPDGPIHRRARRRGAARLPAPLHRVGHGRVGAVRRHLYRLVARTGGAVRGQHGAQCRDDRGAGGRVYRMDHPDSGRQRHALHHGRHHGRSDRDARHAH